MKKKLLSVLLIASIMLTLSPCSVFAAKKIKSKSVSITPTAATISIGDEMSLTATMKPANSTDSLTWSSSNKAIVEVNDAGLIKGISVGSANVTVKTSSNKKATCKITVNDYLNEEKTIKLINENTLSSSEILSMIDKSTSESYVKKGDINSYIDSNLEKKGYITKSDVDSKFKTEVYEKYVLASDFEKMVNAVIAKLNYITASGVDDKITAALSGYVKKSELDDYLDAYLVEKGYLTQTEIQKMIDDAIANLELESKKDDGTLTCTCIPLPTYTEEYKGYEFSLTIDSITVTKTKVMDYVEGHFVKYRYDVETTFTIEGVDAALSHFRDAGIDYEGNIVLDSGEEIYYSLEESYGDIDIEDGTYSTTYSEYLNQDASSFIIDIDYFDVLIEED